MLGFQIGFSGLHAAQQAIELTGVNMSNAATEGYHKQHIVLRPAEAAATGPTATGAGVTIDAVARDIDELLERQLRSQTPEIAHVDQELAVLRSVEAAFGDIEGESLTVAMDRFFNALTELAAQPNSHPHHVQAVWAAQAMADHFRYLATHLEELRAQLRSEARTVVEEVNGITSVITELDGEINKALLRGGAPNLLLDRRDQLMADLAELVDLNSEITLATGATANLQAWGIPLVVSGGAVELQVGTTPAGELGIAAEGSVAYLAGVRGGRLGAILALENDLLPAIEDRLDALARGLVAQINAFHVEGIGEGGSFEQLIGLPVSDETLDQWAHAVTDGTIHLRLTNEATGEVTHYALDVDADVDTVDTLAAAFNALDPNLSAWVADSALRIAAADGWRFDFLPVPPIDTTGGPWNGTAGLAARGHYTGDDNDTLTVTVVGDDPPGTDATVGLTAGLKIEVRNGAGELLDTFGVGAGYAAGDALALGGGLSLAIGVGTLRVGEQFTVQALARSDTSGFLAAAGLNTFLRGDSARSIAVRRELLDEPGAIAVSLSADTYDSDNAVRMAQMDPASLDALGGVSPTEYCRRIVTDVGQQVATREDRREALAHVGNLLQLQRDEVSGVDLNEETANLIMYQQIFTGAAKYIGSLEKAFETLLSLL